MISLFLSPETGFSTPDIVSRIFDIHRPYLDEGLLGFRPPSAYMDACDKGDIILAIETQSNKLPSIDNIVGFAHYRRYVFGNAVRLYAIAIDPLSRRQKIGTKILDFLEQIHARKVITEVRTDNEGSIAFFEKSGYTKVGKANKRGYSVYIYEKPIMTRNAWLWSRDLKHRLYTGLSIS